MKYIIIILILLILVISATLLYFSNMKKVLVQETTKIAIVSMMKNPKNVETWLQTHRNLGITKFYIRLEDSGQDLITYLQGQPDIDLTIGNSTGMNEYLEKQTRQNEFVNAAIKEGEKDGIEWLIHIDSDEILDGNLGQINALPTNVRTFWFQNVEAKYASIPRKEDNCFATAAKYINCSDPNEGSLCASYRNGKSGGRCKPDVWVNGPHRFYSSLPENPDPKLNEMVVQHYESCDFDEYKTKYKGLAVQDKSNDIPFPYYIDSILAAKTGNARELERVYSQYRINGYTSGTA